MDKLAILLVNASFARENFLAARNQLNRQTAVDSGMRARAELNIPETERHFQEAISDLTTYCSQAGIRFKLGDGLEESYRYVLIGIRDHAVTVTS